MRSERDRAYSKALIRREYTKPAMMIAVGLLLTSIILAITDGPAASGANLAVYLIFNLPIGLLIFWLLSVFWIGVDAPLHLTVLRLAAVYAVADVVSVLLGFIPIPIVTWLIAIGVYVGLLMDMLDLELPEAVIVAILTFLAKVFLISSILMWLAN